MCIGSWAGVTYLRYTVLIGPNKDETAVHCFDPVLSVLVIFGVSKRFSRSISLTVYRLYLFVRSINCDHRVGWCGRRPKDKVLTLWAAAEGKSALY